MNDWSSLVAWGVGVRENTPFSDMTTFQLGGSCPVVLICKTADQLTEAVRLLLSKAVPFILLGGGSNLLVSDQGIDCVAVRYRSDQPLIERDGYELNVTASTKLDDLVLFAAQEGLQGLNYASGIPGTVGGAIVGNAGAFGRQIGDVVKTVTVITRQGEIKEFFPEELKFIYRDSAIKHNGDIVLKARLLMTPGNTVELLKERQDILMMRWEKHPDFKTYPSAGSFFRNLEPTSHAGRRQAAGWFLDQAGAKQMRCGGAGVFEKHANIIVKRDTSCCAEDVFTLSKQMAQAVKGMFGLDLVREVRMVGKFAGADYDPTRIIW